MTWVLFLSISICSPLYVLQALKALLAFLETLNPKP